MTRCVFDDMVGQDRVASFLRTAATAGDVSHAYLFVGPPGAGKATAARALACAVFATTAAAGSARRVTASSAAGIPTCTSSGPEGASGYLAEQVRDIIRDVNLSPVDGSHKVYIVSDADLFNDSAANAFLKTLEEPPDDVVIILMSHSFDAVLPTIASRCQVVRFRRIPQGEAVGLLVSETGAERDEAAAALAAAGGVVAVRATSSRALLAEKPAR